MLGLGLDDGHLRKGKSKGPSFYSMHDERGDEPMRERSPRRAFGGGFGGRWKHDMYDEKDMPMGEFRNFGGRAPLRNFLVQWVAFNFFLG